MFTHTRSKGVRPLRRRSTLGLLTLLAASAACSDSDDVAGTGAPVEVPGNYTLTQVTTRGNLGGGGSGIPVTFVDGGGNELTFKSGSLTLDTDGGYDLTVVASYRGSPLEMSDWGTYAHAGASVSFTSTSGNPRLFSGSMQGSTLTVDSQFGNIPFDIALRKQ